MEVYSDITHYIKSLKLQWGHDKIVMEVQTRFDAMMVSVPLQWGHDKIVMEVFGGRTEAFRHGKASMGP